MRHLLFISIIFLSVKVNAQDSVAILKREIYIDSLKEKDTLAIDYNGEYCMENRAATIKIWRNRTGYYCRLLEVKSGVYYKRIKIRTKVTAVSIAQLDSIRFFEAELYFMEKGNCDTYQLSYQLQLPGKTKSFVDEGCDWVGWQGIEGLIAILFPPKK
jgi:hypothetical protein